MFAFRRCRPAERPAEAAADPAARPVMDTAGVIGGTAAAVPVTMAETRDRPSDANARAPRRGAAGDRASVPSGHERLVGTLVHRAFEARVDPRTPVDRIAAALEDSVRPEERIDVPDLGAVTRAAAQVFAAFRVRPDVAAIFDAGRVEFEVPFSYQRPGQPGPITRGIVDAVVVGDDGTVTVVEFKTGTSRPEHDVQAALYAEAFRAVWPGRKLDVKILYP
jgi:ATP-dependent exoDNAse (exonuclease V) beta subunit